MTVYLQYKGGANWRVKKQSHISISNAPVALTRKKFGNYCCNLAISIQFGYILRLILIDRYEHMQMCKNNLLFHFLLIMILQSRWLYLVGYTINRNICIYSTFCVSLKFSRTKILMSSKIKRLCMINSFFSMGDGYQRV